MVVESGLPFKLKDRYKINKEDITIYNIIVFKLHLVEVKNNNKQFIVILVLLQRKIFFFSQ